MHPATPRTTTHRARGLAAALGAAALLASGLVASTTTPAQAAIGDVIWSQEFNGSAGSAPDSSVWNYDTGAGGWGNAELQNYTTSRNNSALDGQGNLVITARRESDGSYTSARLQTQRQGRAHSTAASRPASRSRAARASGRRSGCSATTSPDVVADLRRDRHHGERRQGAAPHRTARSTGPATRAARGITRRLPAPAELVVRRRLPHLRGRLEARLHHLVGRRQRRSTRSPARASAATPGCSTTRSSSSSTSRSAATGPATPTARRSSRSR